MENCRLIEGLVSSGAAPVTRLTLPLKFGSLVWSILPTSQANTLLTGSKLYLPWEGVRLQLSTDLCMGISNITCSTVLPIVCLGPTVMSSLPLVPPTQPPPTQLRLCLTYTGMATW